MSLILLFIIGLLLLLLGAGGFIVSCIGHYEIFGTICFVVIACGFYLSASSGPLLLM